MAFRLVVGNVLEFPVRFVLNDGGTEKMFAFKVRGTRLPASELERDLTSTTQTMREFVSSPKLALEMVDWIGQAPLLDDEGKPAAPGAEALAALYEMLPSIPGLVFAGYAEANGAKGKLGN